jgi:glycosyltransferase involved in cell wall biosynthesis
MRPVVPKVSVVIPCYNQGHFLDEAVASVLTQTYQNFEIIVVNDGSTDDATNRLLENYAAPKTRILHTTNQGLAEARNNGIAVAVGDYILPLDADDKIGSAYMERAVQVLDDHEAVGIVYCQGMYFGEKSGEWKLPEYKLSLLLLDNLIFCSAFFRRADWLAVGGYKKEMIYGWEDYDFWLSLIGLGREVYKIPEPLFYYRARADSMVNAMHSEQYLYSARQIFKNHVELYQQNAHDLYETILSLREEVRRLEEEATHLKLKTRAQQLELDRLLHAIGRKIYMFAREHPQLERQARRLTGELRRAYKRLRPARDGS